MEAQVALVAELQDFFRKRAELELDYSKSLDKMARSIQLRHKEQKQKYGEFAFALLALRPLPNFFFLPPFRISRAFQPGVARVRVSRG